MSFGERAGGMELQCLARLCEPTCLLSMFGSVDSVFVTNESKEHCSER
jgi:hypothetical protein